MSSVSYLSYPMSKEIKNPPVSTGGFFPVIPLQRGIQSFDRGGECGFPLLCGNDTFLFLFTRNNRRRDIVRHVGIVIEFHAVAGTTLSHTA